MVKSWRRVVALATLPVAAGCYELQPLRGSPTTGTRIALDVNDAGRVALGGTMGPTIDRVEGTLIDKSNGEYLLGVSSVALLHGGTQPWKGEHVVVKPEFVSTVYERKIAPVQTGLLIAAIGGSIAYVASRNLVGSGQKDDPGTPIDSIAQRRGPTFRVPLLSIRFTQLPFLGRF